MTVDRRVSKQFCQKCSLLGVQSALQLFQLNDDEAILMCKNADCTFMSSPQWEHLVVKRDISRISSGVSTNQSSSQRKTRSLCSASQPHHPLVHITQSLGSRASTLEQQQSLSHTSRSSTPVGGSSSFEEEKKSLVPIAPFICGHAHSFSSFETKRIEKVQRKKALNPSLYTGSSVENSFGNDRFKTISSVTNRRSSVVVKNRRPSSIESESVSSGSLDSRPTTPTSAGYISGVSSGKKIKKVVVSQETLSRIIDGSLQVKFIKSSKTKGNTVENCYPVTHNSQKVHTPEPVTVTANINHFPVAIEATADTFESKEELKSSHIEAINSFVDSKGIDSLAISHITPNISTDSSDSVNCLIDPQPSLSGNYLVFDIDPIDSQRDYTNCPTVDSANIDFIEDQNTTSDVLSPSFTNERLRDTEECMDFVFNTSSFEL